MNQNIEKQQKPELYDYRLIGSLTILQGMGLLALLGILMAVVLKYYFN